MLQPKIIKIKKIYQGLDDPISDWSNTFLNLVQHLLIRVSELDINNRSDPPIPLNVNTDVSTTVNELDINNRLDPLILESIKK